MGDKLDYDPHDYRDVPNATTDVETLIHLIKGAVGSGILAMPDAFKKAGLWNGLVSTVIIGTLCTYGIHILVKAQYVLCQRSRTPLLTYPQSMKMALESGPKFLQKFANISAPLVDFFLVFYQLGICCVYVLFVSKNMKDVGDEYTQNPIGVRYYMLIFFFPFLMIMYIRSLKLLAPFSTFANILTIVSFGLLCYFVFQGLPNILSRPAIGSLLDYPLYFGTTLFAIESVGVIIAVENNMKTPKSFGGWFGVFNISMVIIVGLYIAMGFIGYWKYGSNILDVITLNIPSKSPISKSIRILYSIAIFISYALQGYVPVQIIWENYLLNRLEGRNHLLLYELSLRFGVVLFTYICAMIVPLLGLFISLFGAFCLSALGFIFPALIDICVKYPNDYGPMHWFLIKDILLMLFGIIGMIIGTSTTIFAIVNEISHMKDFFAL